jgi:hypothetical protein
LDAVAGLRFHRSGRECRDAFERPGVEDGKFRSLDHRIVGLQFGGSFESDLDALDGVLPGIQIDGLNRGSRSEELGFAASGSQLLDG